jgi:hypothetical protein
MAKPNLDRTTPQLTANNNLALFSSTPRTRNMLSAISRPIVLTLSMDGFSPAVCDATFGTLRYRRGHHSQHHFADLTNPCQIVRHAVLAGNQFPALSHKHSRKKTCDSAA